MSEVGILNVGCGDTKLSFDKSDPAECVRAARIVKDMLRRGYALLVEVEQPDGSKKFQRVIEFREDACEYIIADFDPVEAEKADREEASRVETERDEQAGTKAGGGETASSPSSGNGRRGRRKAIPASEARGVAIARSAGG